MICVRFLDSASFLADLIADHEDVSGGIVRVEVHRRIGGEIPTVEFTLRATAMVGGVLYDLTENHGGGLAFADGYDKEARTAWQRAREAKEKLQAECGLRGLETRGGVYGVA